MLNFLKATLKALLAALAAATVLVLIFALWAYKSRDPLSLAGLFGVAAALLSSLAGGAVMGLCSSVRYGGLFFGILYALLTCLFGLIVCPEAPPDFTSCFAIFGGATLAGVIFGKGRTKKPMSLKKYKRSRSQNR